MIRCLNILLTNWRKITGLGYHCFLFFCLFVCSYVCTCGIWRFLGQELKLSHSCDLCHSCSNARSFNPLHTAGDLTATSAATQAAAVRFLTHCAQVGTTRLLLLMKHPNSCELEERNSRLLRWLCKNSAHMQLHNIFFFFLQVFLPWSSSDPIWLLLMFYGIYFHSWWNIMAQLLVASCHLLALRYFFSSPILPTLTMDVGN